MVVGSESSPWRLDFRYARRRTLVGGAGLCTPVGVPLAAGSARCDETALVGGDDKLGSVVDVELHQQPAYVRLGRGGADMQPRPDLGVGEAVGDLDEDLQFA